MKVLGEWRPGAGARCKPDAGLAFQKVYFRSPGWWCDAVWKRVQKHLRRGVG